MRSSAASPRPLQGRNASRGRGREGPGRPGGSPDGLGLGSCSSSSHTPPGIPWAGRARAVSPSRGAGRGQSPQSLDALTSHEQGSGRLAGSQDTWPGCARAPERARRPLLWGVWSEKASGKKGSWHPMSQLQGPFPCAGAMGRSRGMGLQKSLAWPPGPWDPGPGLCVCVPHPQANRPCVIWRWGTTEAPSRKVVSGCGCGQGTPALLGFPFKDILPSSPPPEAELGAWTPPLPAGCLLPTPIVLIELWVAAMELDLRKPAACVAGRCPLARGGRGRQERPLLPCVLGLPDVFRVPGSFFLPSSWPSVRRREK